MIDGHLKVAFEEYNEYHTKMLEANDRVAHPADVAMLGVTSLGESTLAATVPDAWTSEKPVVIVEMVKKHAHSRGLRVSHSRQTTTKLSNVLPCSAQRRWRGVSYRTRFTKRWGLYDSLVVVA